jgi:hypothetical protein
MSKKKLVAISNDDIKTYHDFKSWILRNCNVDDFDDALVGAIIDEICLQIKSSGEEGSGLFCFNLKKIGERA